MNVAVLLSGGVDSSLALALLQREKRLALKAYYLKIWLEDELFSLGDCPWETDLTYARATCEQLGVPLEVVPLQSEYRDHIVEYALAELRLGRTPSPDIWCNQRVKFGAFYQRVANECEQIASGHYARVEETADGYRLRRAADPVKDQTYFLSNLSQAQLARLCLPIGHLHKHQVRALAAEFDLPAKDRPDSQGMCFLGKINYRDFVRFHLGEARGDIVEQASGAKEGRAPRLLVLHHWPAARPATRRRTLVCDRQRRCQQHRVHRPRQRADANRTPRADRRTNPLDCRSTGARRAPRQAPAWASPDSLSGADARARSRPRRLIHARPRHCSGPTRRVLRR